MGCIALCGLRGAGKNLYSVYLAVNHYKKMNSPLYKLKLKLYNIKVYLLKKLLKSRYKKEQININKDYYINNRLVNVYSNFPILLDKKRNIYCREVNIHLLNGSYNLIPNSLVIIDEIQLYFDSLDFKIFPRNISTFNQASRHFGINDLVYISQHPDRIPKNIRDICDYYMKIKYFKPFLFNKFCGIFSSIIYYELNNYNMPIIHQKKKEIPFDFKKVFKFGVNLYNLYNRYDTQYLSKYMNNKPYLLKSYTSLTIDNMLIKDIFK